jgi:hypothetical protein
LILAIESGECDYYRSGILLSAKTEIVSTYSLYLKPSFQLHSGIFHLQDGTEVLCSGTLTLSKDPDGCWGPVIRWTQDTHNPHQGSKNEDLCGSLPGLRAIEMKIFKFYLCKILATRDHMKTGEKIAHKTM